MYLRLLAGAAGAAAVALVGAGLVEARVVPKGALVVHEWGTFTSMQGSDGVTLEGLHHEEEPLPDFVHSQVSVRQRRADVARPTATPAPTPRPPWQNRPQKGVDFAVEGVTQKMETPVIYFHTNEPQHVQVNVGFDHGLLTQWFPATTAVTPVAPADGRPLDVASITRSSLTWEGDVLPGQQPPEVPAVSADDPWSFAREVDAAPFRTSGRGQIEAEQYLFYRGLGTFHLPVQIAAEATGRASVRNSGTDALPVAFAVEVTTDQARFKRIGAVAAGTSADASLAQLSLEPKAQVMERLAQAVQSDLVAQGLFDDEARAMVRTWARQWFGSVGNRVLYLVPRPVIDRILPLQINPSPTSLVRVLLGRLEFETVAAETAVEQALADRTNPAKRAAAQAYLDGLGRFLEAHVRRALAHSTDPVVRASAQEVLAKIQ